MGDDRGAGQLSTMFGVLVFLVFMLFSMQLLIGLFTRSAATDAAMLGAQRMARGATPAEARFDVEQLVGNSLVAAAPVTPAEDPTLGPDDVAYRVQVRAPGFLGRPWLGPWATDDIVRQGRARLEARR